MIYTHTFCAGYAFFWLAFCAIAVWIAVRDLPSLRREMNGYPKSLCIKWKLATFALSFVFVTFAGRFTDDETWDVISGSGMSILTFLTAPLAAGMFYQIIKGRRTSQHLVIVAALCLFSSSWFYDGYIYLRDGEYTTRWLANLMLSPAVYIVAGLFWNLEVASGGKVTFSFFRSDWPMPTDCLTYRPLLIVAVPLAIIVAMILTLSVHWYW